MTPHSVRQYRTSPKVGRSFTGRIKAHTHRIKEFQVRGRQYISRWETCLAHVLVGVGTWSQCLSYPIGNFAYPLLLVLFTQFFFLSGNVAKKKNSSVAGGGIGGGMAFAKALALRVTLNLDGTPIISKSHTHPSHSRTSRLLTSSL